MKKKNNFNKFAAITYQPKFIDPDGNSNIYFVPAVKKQQDKNNNYIAITCSPEYNGLYQGNKKETDYRTWKNGCLDIYYVPFDECNKICDLNDIPGLCKNEDENLADFYKWLKRNVVKQQTDGINGKVWNQSRVYKKVPEGCLKGVKLTNTEAIDDVVDKDAKTKESKPQIANLTKVKLW